MLFIDHDEPKVAIGQIKRRPCADRDQRLAARNGAVGAPALRLAEIGMPSDGRMAESIREAAQERLSQRDFWQQDQRLLAHADRLGNRLKIDLGLAGPSDAIKQDRRERLCRHHRDQRGRRVRLFR